MCRPVESHSGLAGSWKPLSGGPISQPHSVCSEMDRGIERDEETWGRVSPHHASRVWGSAVSSPNGVRDGAGSPVRKWIFMYILGQKEAIWDTLFSIFKRWRGPQTPRGPGKLPLSSPLDGPVHAPVKSV